MGGALEDDQELALQAVPAEDASNEPVPVMLQEGQGDVKEIEEILDRALSLAEDEWDSQLSSKVSKLALQVGMNWEMLLGKSSKGQAGGGDVPGGASPRIQMPSGCSGSQVQEEIKGEDAGNQEVELEMEPFRGPLKLGLKKQKSLRFLQTDPGADVADSKPKAVKIEEQDWVKSDDEEDDDEEDYDSITILQRGKGGDKVSHKATPSSAEKSSRAGEAAPTRIRDGKTPRDSFFFQDSIQTRDEEREKKEARQARLEELQRRVKEKRAKNASVQQERERQEKERLEKLRMEAPDKEAKGVQVHVG